MPPPPQNRVRTLASYVLQTDSGFAPNPFFGLCTLACCKPSLRRGIGRRLLAAAGTDDLAELRRQRPDFIRDQGIWVIGLAGTALRDRPRRSVVYLMQVTDVLDFESYYHEHPEKRPDRGPGHRPDRGPGHSSADPSWHGDAIYDLDDPSIAVQATPSAHSDGDRENEFHKDRDLRGKYILLSDHFIHFGLAAPYHPIEQQLQRTIGHRINHAAQTLTELEALLNGPWLDLFDQPPIGQVRRTASTSCGAGQPGRTPLPSLRPTTETAGCSPAVARPTSRERAGSHPAPVGKPQRVVLSRKGFDSQYGRIPSPILPDGTLLSLPIPTTSSGRRFDELHHGSHSYAELIRQLGGDPSMAVGCCHLDPDLRPGAAAGWVPAFGQTGAAQSHLANQCVGVGDLFLFFGRFRQTEFDPSGRLRYRPGAPNQHILFGYLQIGAIITGERIREYPWHPHAENPHPLPNNTLYLATPQLLSTGLPGAGVFDLRGDRVLTAAGQSQSRWRVLDWMNQTPISYHSQRSLHLDHFQSAAKGQEFVVAVNDRVLDWVESIL